VLEAITGISLPRGQNTVTKCPLIIQSRKAKDNDEYAEIYYENEKKVSNRVTLQKLSEAIIEAQNCLTEKEEISDIPIHIKLFKNNSPDLTLYDLPGLTYKTESIEKKIKQLITKFTEGKDTLIMLILPANVDLTTSEAISIIKKNEDYKERTLAVITKIDLGVQEKGLFNKIINNELGLSFDPIVVRNRTQEELENNESITSIRDKERLIIESTELKKLNENSKGTDQLIKKLLFLQKDKLLSSKFDIRDMLIKDTYSVKQEISKLPISICTSSEKINAFKNLLRVFETSYIDLLEGNNINNKQNNVAARIQERFVNFNIENFLNNNSKFMSDKYNEKITEIVKESRGLKLANFMDTKAFKMLFTNEIEIIEENVYKFIEDIYDYMKSIILTLSKQSFKSFHNLNNAIESEISICFEEQKALLNSETKKLLDLEKLLIYTSNSYYMDVVSKVRKEINMNKEEKKSYPEQEVKSNNSPFGSKNAGYISSQPTVSKNTEPNNCLVNINDISIQSKYLCSGKISKAHSDSEMAIQNIQISLFAYFKVFEKRFADYFYLNILKHLVYYFSKDFINRIEDKFSPYPGSFAEHFIADSEETVSKRKKLTERLSKMDESYKIINSIF